MTCSLILSPLYPALVSALIQLSQCESKNQAQIYIQSLLAENEVYQVAEYVVEEYGGVMKAVEVLRCE